MIESQLLAFSVVAAALTLSPGSDTLLVIRSVIQGGRNRGIITSVGICCGLFFHACFSALGLSVVLVESAEAFMLVKTLGACYLVWLGIQSLRSVLDKSGGLSLEPGVGQRRPAYRRCFVEGFFNNILNPKTAVFYLAFLPQFISPGDPVLVRSLLLAGVHFLMALLWLVFLSFLLDRGRNLFARSSTRRWLDGICGAMLIGLGLRLAMEKR